MNFSNSLATEMLERFDSNIKALQAYHPNLYHRLEKEIEKFRNCPVGDDNESFHFFEDNGKNTNLLYRRKKPACEIALHSVDPSEEIRRVFQKADLSFPQMVLFFGSGLGHLPQYFFKNRPSTNSVMILIEPNAQIFMRALCHYDWQAILAEERFFFIINNDLAQVQERLGDLLGAFTTVNRHLKILATPSALQIDSQFYMEAAKLALSMRDHTTFLVGNNVPDSFIGFQNTLHNIPMALHSPGILALADKFKSKTAISVAAGPSAEEHWDALRAVQGKIPIFACDVLLRPMLAKGIVPDVVCAVERIPIVASFFRDVEVPERTMLIGPLLLLKETFDVFQGAKTTYCPVVQNAKGIGLEFLGLFHPGSSAGNLNLALAAHMGFENVILVGHNLAFGYESKTSHIKGTGTASQEKEMSEEELLTKSKGRKYITQDGSVEVYTKDVWNMFRKQIENLISKTPQMRWINTAPKGAKIEGTELMSFKEALEATKGDDLDFYSVRKEVMKNPDEFEVARRREYVLGKLEESRSRVEHWKNQSDELLEKFKQWRKKIEDKETLGKTVSLDFLNRSIDEVLKLKVEAVNDDPIFNNAFISIILPLHIAFERTINEMPGKGHYKDNYSLKKDFLLEHESYFKTWQHWLPRVLDELNSAIASLK